MSEIYRDTTNKKVMLGVEGAVITDVSFLRNGVSVQAGALDGGATIPYAITHMDGDFEVLWRYKVQNVEYTRREGHTVVTPFFSKEELVSYNSTFAKLTDTQVVNLERLCRNIIEGYTGQSFGYEEGFINVYGGGDSILISPKRIISVSSVGAMGFPGSSLGFSYRPIKNGYAIERDGYLSNYDYSGDEAKFNGTIYAPNTFAGGNIFRNNVGYTVRGSFGWTSPPQDIKDAAMLLAEEFSCREATWRDRYLKAVTAADWRFDFDSRAFTGTGSVTVDALLSKYIVNKMAII